MTGGGLLLLSLLLCCLLRWGSVGHIKYHGVLVVEGRGAAAGRKSHHDTHKTHRRHVEIFMAGTGRKQYFAVVVLVA